ncbi:hypothetical protein [uncultured Anaerococcus sp.]|uniref:hypothetical protein n=1 Tax=uncultured Anaerococcus sp. TaxID=293428 RepID=UPI0025E16E8B|nr:hypothetical protein [uncultured Anaerococcus sp.]
MKTNKFAKVMLALALGSAALAPSFKEAQASEVTSISESQKYENALKDLKKAIEDANSVKLNFKYINAETYYKQNFDSRLADASALLNKLPAKSDSASLREDVVNKTYFLNKASKELNGQKSSLDQLNKLVEDDVNFIKKDAYRFADEKLKKQYIAAYNSAREYYLLDEARLANSEVERRVNNLKAAREAIQKTYAPLEERLALKAEIQEAAKLKDKKDSYTKASFDSFLSALRLAETSMNDSSSFKTAEEYKELRNSLKSAREALVKVKKTDEKLDKAIEKLEEAIERNLRTRNAAELLINKFPQTVKTVKPELEKLIKVSKEQVEEAEKLLKKLKGIEG